MKKTDFEVKTKEASLEALKEFIPGFYECVVSGFNEYFRVNEPSLHIHRKTTKANIIYDHIIHNLKRKYVNNSHVRFLNKKKLLTLVVLDEFLIKFKKLDANRKSSNVKTYQNSDFQSQKRLFDLDGLTHLEIGYIVNEFGNEIINTYMVCPANNKRNHWEENLEEYLEMRRSVNLFTPQEIAQKKNRFTIKKELLKGVDDETGKVG